MEEPLFSKQPVINHLSRENELVGGIKNALERGEPMQKIKQSFLNAGYKSEEVNSAVRKLSPQFTSEQSIPTLQPVKESFFSKKQPALQPQAIQQQPAQIQQPKQISKIWLISLIIISALILIGAAVLGLYWNKLFS